jgi:hypothetical protein
LLQQQTAGLGTVVSKQASEDAKDWQQQEQQKF